MIKQTPISVIHGLESVIAKLVGMERRVPDPVPCITTEKDAKIVVIVKTMHNVHP